MKLRKLDREYAEVHKATIKTDPSKYEGLEQILQKEIQDIKRGRREPEIVKQDKQEESDEDDFGEFQEAGAYQEIGSDAGDSESDKDDQA